MTRDKLRNIFQSSFSYENWQSVLVSLFSGVGKNCQLSLESTPQQMPVAKEEKMDGFYIGEIRIGMESVKLYTFHIKDDRTNISRNRVGLRNTVNYLRDVNDAAIVVYYNNHQWRVSYICDIIRSLKRFSFVFGDQQTLYTTPIKRFENLSEGDISLDSILEAFSVEALSKDFFKSYKAQYDKFCNHIGNHIKSNRDYVKKMMGRLVFLQFLQKKGWLNGDYNFLQNLYANSEYKDDYLESVLEPLFFGVLNTKPEEREQIFKKNGWDLSLLKEWKRIQYLNGGLFEADNNDKKREHFDKGLFANLFDFFSQYNFTIDENDPSDAEVGIDPEMLGHIFENLLEDNKDKGAFYTPKEIVQYMCRQSLIEYLQSKLGKHESIEKFVNTHDAGRHEDKDNFIAKNVKEIERLLEEVKICDPAIGSGAFPMGMLNEIFHCKMALNMTLDRATVKKNIIQNNIYGVDIEQGAVDIARLRFWLSLVVDEDAPQPLPNLDYKIVCGNSLITTFDGKPIDLHRQQGLNSRKIKEKKSELYSLQSEFYNLNGEEKHKKEVEIKRCLLEIIELQIDYKLESNKQNQVTTPSIFEPKKKIKKVIVSTDLGKQRLALVSIKTKLFGIRPIEELSQIEVPLFDWEIIFSDIFSSEEKEKRGFDIVIGNPPYIQLQVNGGYLADQLKGAKYETFTRMGDIYCIFYERGMQILRDGGIETFITSSKWMKAAYGDKTRAYFAKFNPIILIELGANIFESATVDTNILILQKSENTDHLLASKIDSVVNLNRIEFTTLSNLNNEIWTISAAEQQSIKAKITKYGTPLKRWDFKINFGIKTGYNEAFIISEEKRTELITVDFKSKELIKPLLRGRDIGYYSSTPSNQYLICTFPAQNINIDDYTAIKEYLLSFGKRLHQTGEKDIDGIKNNNARKKTTNKWFETQDPIAYHRELSKPKIVWKRIGSILRFCYDETGGAVLDSTCFATGNGVKYLVAVLNSKMGHYLLQDAPKTGTGDLLISVQALEPICIPKLSELEQQPLIALVDQILEAKKANTTADTTALEAQIDQMVYALYKLSEEEIVIIEK